MAINRELIKLAARAVYRNKSAAVPAGMAPDPGAGGGAPPGMPPGMPMDPSMMGGGAPPGMPPGMPPMDPSMGGGMPPGMPMDPSMMGGGAPPAPAPTGDMNAVVQNAVSQALSQAGLNGSAGGAAGRGGKAAPKPDINTIATDVFQLKKMLLAMFHRLGWELPPDILDGPNRDPVTGAPADSPDGGSIVQPGASVGGAGGGAGGPGASSIQPIEPMQGAFPGGGPGGGDKQAYAVKGLQPPRRWDSEPSRPSVGVPFTGANGRIVDRANALASVLAGRRECR